MKKIMFNDRYGLTDAVLEKRKTVTRRVLKQTKPRSLANCLQGLKYECMVDENDNNYEAPYYVGEIVAVAQSYKNAGYAEDKIFYRYIKEHDGYLPEPATKDKGWTNKMFVCADLMPHQIRIVDVRAERLQDITEEDCLREGVRLHEENPGNYFIRGLNEYKLSPCAISQRVGIAYEPMLFSSPREAYALLIDKISGKGTWKANPYMWRIEFELVTEKQ